MADSEFVTQGNLFTRDFLAEAITKTLEWAAITDAELAAFGFALTTVFKAFPRSKNPNEAQTEDDLIWKVLERLGWVDFLRQQNLAARGRDDVPDGVMLRTRLSKRRPMPTTRNGADMVSAWPWSSLSGGAVHWTGASPGGVARKSRLPPPPRCCGIFAASKI
jgi:hypothetical protein